MARGEQDLNRDMRRRRLQTMSGRSELTERPREARDDNEVPEGARTVGPKLTPSQRTILIRLVAVHHFTDVIRLRLAEEYPGFPEITDDLIRYYRRKIEAGGLAEAEAAREQALRTGLANKTIRVQFLIDMAGQLRRVPLVEDQTSLGPDGRPRIAYTTRTDVARELREVLKQIAAELGQPGMNPETLLTALDRSGGVGDTQNDELEQARAELREKIERRIEREVAERIALAGAQRPAPVDFSR
jgi:hypothetical protein